MIKSIVRSLEGEPSHAAPCHILHLSYEDTFNEPLPSATIRRRHTALHSHPFWQLELVTRGTIHAEAGDSGPQVLEAGWALLLPPGVLHRFWYEAPHAFHSVRFRLAAAGQTSLPQRLHPGRSGGALLSELAHLFEKLCELERSASALPVAEHVLAAVALHAVLGAGETAAPASEDPLERLTALCHRKPECAATVSGVARELGYTPGHLSALYRKRHGRSLKGWLDEQRAESAAAQLSWADHSIGELSRRLGFPDPLTFSHFFKRVKGMSPKAWRKKRLAELARGPGD